MENQNFTYFLTLILNKCVYLNRSSQIKDMLTPAFDCNAEFRNCSATSIWTPTKYGEQSFISPRYILLVL